jgi:prepilin-type processing-associated H-X9-DG protein
MRPRFWSFRTFGALWGILLSPLAPTLADGRDLADVLPADTLAYFGWTQLYDQSSPDWQRAKQFVEQAAGADFTDPDARMIARLMELMVQTLQAPAVIALLDLATIEDRPDVQAVAIVRAGPAAAKISELLEELLRTAPHGPAIEETSIQNVPMKMMPVPDAPLQLIWGVHQGHFLLTLGRNAAEKAIACLNDGNGGALADSEELKFARRKLGVGGEPGRASGFIDVQRTVAKVRALADQMAGPMPPIADKLIEALGVNAIRSAYLHTTDSEYGPLTRAFVHVEGQRKGMLKLWEQAPLSPDDLKVVPKDAYWAQVWNLDLARLWSDTRKTIREIDPNMVPMVEASVAMTASFLGFSITDQLLPAFGDTWAVFDARGHGGILLTGSVLVAEVRDADAVHGALARTVELLRPMLQQKEVNLALQETTCQDCTVHYVLIGGVPCPVAPAWTFVGDRMVFGLFPQTVAVAARQVDPKTRSGSILDHPPVSQVLKDVFPSQIQSFGYMDADYFARLFYPLGLLYSTAGVSMLTVPGVELDPSFYPVLAEAIKDVDPSMGASAADDDGLYYAQMGASSGVLAGVAVGALVVAILLPSLARARELAKRAVSASNLRGIGQGMHIYANDHDGRFPERFDDLIKAGMIVPGYLNSPRDDEGNVSYVYVSGQTDNDDPRNVLAYEKIIGDEGTIVLFLDGHVQWMKLPDFKKGLSQTYQRLGREAEMPPELRP